MSTTLELARSATASGHWLAADRQGAAEVRFVGHGPETVRDEVLAAVGGSGLELAWCRQVHSDRAVEAASGECGEADALVTDRAGLALCVATADCVPVVIAGGGRLAAVHAGWRGIAAAIVPKTLARLGEPALLTAWLGPAIGPCCYEVGREVAEAVAAAGGPEAWAGAGSAPSEEPLRARPHLDLHRAVTFQLERCGVTVLRRVEACTRCHPDQLASYRRDGRRAGRNLTFAWLVA